MKNQSFRKRFGFAFVGLQHALKNEASFRTQAIIGILVFVALAWLGASVHWWAIITICISLVLSLELLNTALETFMDQVHPDQHRAIGLAKDCAAGAVLIASLFSVLIFVFYLADRFHLL